METPNDREGLHKIEDINRKLYGRGARLYPLKRGRLSQASDGVSHEWRSEAEKPKPVFEPEAPRGSFFLTKVLYGSIIFFVLAVSAALFIFFGGYTTISNRDIDLAFNGPAVVKAGSRIDLNVSVINRNKNVLDDVELLIDYPAGTRAPGDPEQELTHDRLSLGAIEPKQVKNGVFSLLVFGEEQTTKEAKISVEYRLRGSNAIYKKNENYSFAINASPLNVTADVPGEVNASQEIIFDIKAISNSESLLEDMLIEVSYPPGFRFTSANYKPAFGNNVWDLGDISSGEERNIKVRGTMEGQNEEIKSFRVSVGTQAKDNKLAIGIPYSSLIKTVTIKKPFVAMDVLINGQSKAEFAVSSRQKLKADMQWVNNLPTNVTDGEVKVYLSGEVIDRSTVEATNGFYSSADNTIIFNKNTDSSLGMLSPGQAGRSSFSFGFRPLLSTSSPVLGNPEADIKVVFTGKRVSDDSPSENVEVVLTKKIKIESAVELSALGYFRSGAFDNSGPMPPAVGKLTTYTVTWSLANSSNDLKNVMVKAALPPYIKWQKAVSPANERVTYDQGSGQVVWNVGTLPAGSGVIREKREVSFQVGLVPSLSQAGSMPNLLLETKLSGFDNFTNTTINLSKAAVSTHIVNDPGFRYKDDVVIK